MLLTLAKLIALYLVPAAVIIQLIHSSNRQDEKQQAETRYYTYYDYETERHRQPSSHLQKFVAALLALALYRLVIPILFSGPFEPSLQYVVAGMLGLLCLLLLFAPCHSAFSQGRRYFDSQEQNELQRRIQGDRGLQEYHHWERLSKQDHYSGTVRHAEETTPSGYILRSVQEKLQRRPGSPEVYVYLDLRQKWELSQFSPASPKDRQRLEKEIMRLGKKIFDQG
jgi:hypothetical protein